MILLGHVDPEVIDSYHPDRTSREWFRQEET
jgi:hypothetical protein